MISTKQFLRSIFSSLNEGHEVVCVQDGVCAAPQIWPTDNAVTHFNTSTLVLKSTRRIYPNCARQHCIVLDDIGTKSNKQYHVVPHWVLETSKDNFQEGFVIVPEECTPAWRATFNDFIKQAAHAGYTDPGATSPNRLVRLPGSIKQGSDFYARLVEWHPLLPAHQFQQMLEAMKLRRRARPTSYHQHPCTEIEVEEDIIAQWLCSIGAQPERYEDTILIPFRCPFEHESGTSGARDAAYWPQKKLFSCFHASCKQRRDLQARFRRHIAERSGLYVKTKEAQIIVEAQRKIQ